MTLFRQHCGVARHAYNFGSKNRAKATSKLAKTHAKVSNIRKDATHKLTYDIAKNQSVIKIEELSIKAFLTMV
ncbi:transposase [Cylindrospermopsis curvispora]|uniref:transposase n=1 Tax=Cylindrospermopsis curvispora TaxID=747548 RepID=UPI001F1A29F2|nr:transposase [Cylindrospermopsis curvispora]